MSKILPNGKNLLNKISSLWQTIIACQQLFLKFSKHVKENLVANFKIHYGQSVCLWTPSVTLTTQASIKTTQTLTVPTTCQMTALRYQWPGQASQQQNKLPQMHTHTCVAGIWECAIAVLIPMPQEF